MGDINDTLIEQSVPVQPAPAYWSIEQVAERWQCSAGHVRNVFANEPGVLDVGTGRQKMLRIPAGVLSAVETARTNRGFAAVQGGPNA